LPVLIPLGFRASERDPVGVAFSSATTRLRVSYWPEEAPDYYLLVAIGGGGPTVAAEYMLADMPGDRRFSTESELRSVCHRLSQYVGDSPTVQHALSDDAAVEQAVALGLATTAELDRRDVDASVATLERAAAANAWGSADWDSVVYHLERIPVGQARPSDAARKAYAVRRSDSG